MKYLVLPQCVNNIKQFYHNVAKKYAHTYSKELMHKNIDDAIDSMYKIENGPVRRHPTLDRWKGCHMAKCGKWYFAYQVYDDTVVVIDAMHSQNMTN